MDTRSSVCVSERHWRKWEDAEDLWGYAKRLRFVLETIAECFPNAAPDSLRVLDVGCGNGSQLALPLVECGFELTGVDVDLSSITCASEMASGARNARFLCMHVEELSADQRFDVVILSEVLEHVNEPDKLVADSVRFLAEDGVLIVTVPNGFGEFEIDSWLFRALYLQGVILRAKRIRGLLRRPSHRMRHDVPSTENHASGHVHFFTLRRLRRLFAACSLRVIREAPGVFLCGPVIGHTLARYDRFIRWNARITDKLPLAFASSWYFVLQRSSEIKRK